MEKQELSQVEYKTFLCLTALCLPRTKWAAEFLQSLGHAMNIPEPSVDGAVTLTYTSYGGDGASSESMMHRAESMATSLRSSLTKESAVQGLVTILLLILRGKEFATIAASCDKNSNKKEQKKIIERYQTLTFDARTSVLLRRLSLLLRVRLSALAALEEIAIREMQEESALLQQESKNKTPDEDSSRKATREKNKWLRTAKIGAAATAAGGLLFVTGGLAAPALAVGLAGLGLGGAAALATTTTVAALLGGAGAGLGAYKMSRRTKGVTTFEFHRINGENDSDDNVDEERKGMTVYICVSGGLRQAGPAVSKSSKQDAATSPDFYGPWGAQPPYMFPAQTLDRFYAVVASKKRRIVPELLKRYTGREEELWEKLFYVYNVHPKSLKPDSSRPTYFLLGKDAVLFKTLLRDVLKHVKELMVKRNDSRMSSEILSSSEIVSLLIDFEKTWDDAVQAPKPHHVDRIDSEDRVHSQEAIEAAIAELEAKLKDNVDEKEDIDSATREMLIDEIELLDMEEVVPPDKPTVGSGSMPASWMLKPAAEQNIFWWRESIANYGDQYTIVWEPEKLLAIGQCVDALIKEGINKGIGKALQFTALSAVLSAVAMPLAIANFFGSLDENWTMTVDAADEAGLLLADALMSEAHGNRPVVLVGYSVGGRVVAKCLTELAAIARGSRANKRKDNKGAKSDLDEDEFEFLTDSIDLDDTLSEEERKRRLRAATVVRDAVIIGAPCDSAGAKWAQRRSVVLGRLINAYCPTDWVLALLYRYKRWSVVPLAGLQEVRIPSKQKDSLVDDDDNAIENFDVSDIVNNHGDYPSKIEEILKRVAIGDVSSCEEYHGKYFLDSTA